MRRLKSPVVAPVVAASVLAALAVAGCARDNSDPANGRSGLLIYTDSLTGCQYLARPGLGEALTPRQNPDGSQVCEQMKKGALTLAPVKLSG